MNVGVVLMARDERDKRRSGHRREDHHEHHEHHHEHRGPIPKPVNPHPGPGPIPHPSPEPNPIPLLGPSIPIPALGPSTPNPAPGPQILPSIQSMAGVSGLGPLRTTGLPAARSPRERRSDLSVRRPPLPGPARLRGLVYVGITPTPAGAKASGTHAYKTPAFFSAKGRVLGRPHPPFTSIFFAGLCASGFLGSVTLRTRFLKLASILSTSTVSRTRTERANEPNSALPQMGVLLLFDFLVLILAS